ncbi:MAG: iron ABC transporter permease [Prevotella sp.]|nr:iron ABC transporter permease [Prevotella sp.]MDY4843656.1 iron ABC transporter permease [Prevotella sp.]
MRIKLMLLAVSLPILFLINLAFGSVSIPLDQVANILTGGSSGKASWDFIILQSRLPQAITAIFCGASLAVSGLMLQTYFRNPLAGPSVLGISNGASLGVAIVMLALGGTLGAAGEMGTGLKLTGSVLVIIAAFAGAVIVTMLYLVVTRFIKSNLIILILGIMVGYMTSSVVTLLNFFATVENVHSFVSWGMGSFSNVTTAQLPLLCGTSLVGIIIALALTKSFNMLLLGENYAANLGANLSIIRSMVLISTGILTAVTTAFCGPVSFIGLAVPHIARLLINSEDHRVLLPATLMSGAAIAMLCNIISVLPQQMIIPLNAVTPLFGAPVIIYIILKRK